MLRNMFVFFKQKTAYEMRISDWSSDVCSSDLVTPRPPAAQIEIRPRPPLFWSMILASVARIRPPVAANGWPAARLPPLLDRQSVGEGTSVSGRVDLGGRRIIKTQKNEK